MQNGTIKFFNEIRGFGFITGEDGEDYFVHISNIDIEPEQYPQKGQKVRFDVKCTAKNRPEAVSVQLV